MSIGRVLYTKQNLRIELKSEAQDCVDCEAEVQAESTKIIEQAREKVRARKNGTPPTV